MASGSRGGGGSDFSVVVVGSDVAEANACFSDLEERQVVRVQGTDRARRTIVRVVGKFFPAPAIDGERLKKYVFYKLRTELPVGPFCILYMHSTVQSDDNNPGVSILRTIYEELSPEYKERLQVFYFLHPGLRSRLAIATLGRLFLSGGLYWKIKYISRLEYLWGDIRKGEVEIPDFVIEHDKVLEHRPLTDYGIEPDPLHLADVPAEEVGYSLGRYEDKWTPEDRWYSRNYM
uniref:Cellular retinaldehyde-binding/triple function, C-terminal n=1 Tax=Zea mays TaxID=4577 RepID=B6UAB5_MAIZE|nr:cellular retinaldehyde-binding/triple function, C-terminal [Zea mays]